jgi:hypothetical protein
MNFSYSNTNYWIQRLGERRRLLALGADPDDRRNGETGNWLAGRSNDHGVSPSAHALTMVPDESARGHLKSPKATKPDGSALGERRISEFQSAAQRSGSDQITEHINLLTRSTSNVQILKDQAEFLNRKNVVQRKEEEIQRLREEQALTLNPYNQRIGNLDEIWKRWGAPNEPQAEVIPGDWRPKNFRQASEAAQRAMDEQVKPLALSDEEAEIAERRRMAHGGFPSWFRAKAAL